LGLLSVVTKSNIFTMSKQIIRRGAFDIGSGATKLQVSDVDVAAGTINQTYFGQERPVPFGADWLKSSDGCLSAEMQNRGINTLKDLLAIGEQHGVEAYSAIATEVFRKASNGAEFLDRVRDLGVKVTIVSQELEAELGYATALAVSGSSPSAGCIAWDSGGASFQITTRPHPEDRKSHEMLMYMGALGSGIATAELVEGLRGFKLADVSTPNPVSLSEADALVESLKRKLTDVPQWLQGANEVIAIGGPNSIFRLACDVLTVLKMDTMDSSVKVLCGSGGESDPNYVHSFTADDVRRAVEECVDKSDEYLQRRFIDFEHADPPTIIVPKLCLLYAVMSHTGIRRVRAMSAIGSCGGLLITESQWE
jgi:hypothetical protein